MKKLLSLSLLLVLGFSLFLATGCEAPEGRSYGTLTPSETSVTIWAAGKDADEVFKDLTFTFASTNTNKVADETDTTYAAMRAKGMTISNYSRNQAGTVTFTYWGATCTVEYGAE